MHKFKLIPILLVIFMLAVLAGPSFNVLAARSVAASDPGLGTAANSSILATTGITNVGTSSTSMDIDVSPSCAGAPVGLTVGGATHICDTQAAGVLADALAADLNMLGQPLTSNQGPVLDGLTLPSGVYDVGAMQINGGVLTLDGPGVYIFRATSSAVSSGSINFINGARACDLYWHVDTLATLNGSSFAGTIIAGTGVHMTNGVTLDGRALAINGDVTLINNVITGPSCAAVAATATVTATAIAAGTSTVTPSGPIPVTNTPDGRPRVVSTPAIGLPQTGGGPIRKENFTWVWVLLGSISIVALGMGVRAYRRNDQSK